MLSVEWSADSGWGEPKVAPYQNLSLAPSCSTFHYALEVSKEFFVVIRKMITDQLSGARDRQEITVNNNDSDDEDDGDDDDHGDNDDDDDAG